MQQRRTRTTETSREGALETIAGYRRPPPGTQPEYLHPSYASSVKRAPTRPSVLVPHTLSEVTGPIFGREGVRPNDHDLTAQHEGEPLGERIIVTGRVLDEDGQAISNTLVEVWQANAAGRYAHPEDDREDVPLEDGFMGFGRCATDSEGRFEFLTVKPGSVPGPGDRPQAPHIDVSVFARGLLNRLVTRIYFPDESEANAEDAVLSLIQDKAARQTLIAQLEDGALRFDIRLQGDGETTFFVI